MGQNSQKVRRGLNSLESQPYFFSEANGWISFKKDHIDFFDH